MSYSYSTPTSPPKNYAQKTYGSSFRTFTPKSPVKSFRDLETYQKALFLGVAVCKEVQKNLEKGSASALKASVADKLCQIALEISQNIATAHSIRFSDSGGGIKILEKAMLSCNLLCVYLEQFQGFLVPGEIEPAFFEEKIKEALVIRGKAMRLQASWKKFSVAKQQ